MKFYELRRAEGIDALSVSEWSTPRPGASQVLVRVRAASLNYRDLIVVRGGYGRNLKLPLIPLSDGAGEVVELGPGVTRVRTGDRVAGIFMQRWLSGGFREEYGASAMGGAIDGTLAEYVALDADGLVAVPDHLSWEEAATLPCAAVTAWHALFPAARIGAGDTVLVLGGGGVSLFALQLARIAGARVLAVARGEERGERLKKLGAETVVDYRANPDWGKAIREATGGAGVDCVVEVGGPGTMEQSLRAVRAGGTISLMGVAAGKGEFNLNWIFLKAVRLMGIYVGSRDMFEAMNRAISAARMRPVIDRVFPFAEAREAMRYMETGGHVGKIVIRLD